MVSRSNASVDSGASYRLAGETVECVPCAYDEEALLRRLAARHESGFFVVDLGCVRQQLALWRRELPRVHPFYAVKCNPNPVIIALLASLGVNFDCASLAEIDLVLSLGVAADRIIFANPCKFPAHIREARARGVHTMTFDNADELDKIAVCNPQAQLVLRIATNDARSKFAFSAKFGARADACEPLVRRCAALGLQLIGVSFHVGSGCGDAQAFPDALRAARTVFDVAAAYGFTLTLLDVGGGYPGTPEHNPSFAALAASIRPALEALFPAPHVRVIAEPGRFVVARSHTLLVRCYGRRLPAAPADPVLYYVDDGVYGSLSCIAFDAYRPEPVLLLPPPPPQGTDPGAGARPLLRCTLFGPTCDSVDTVLRDAELPLLHPGDWLYFRRMGAYTCASRTRFNGFESGATLCYIDSDRHAMAGAQPLPAFSLSAAAAAAGPCVPCGADSGGETDSGVSCSPSASDSEA